MKVEFDTDQALKAGFRWVKNNVPALPATFSAVAYLCWSFLWSMTYTPEPYPPGFPARCWMAGLLGVVTTIFSIVFWVNYAERSNHYN